MQLVVFVSDVGQCDVLGAVSQRGSVVSAELGQHEGRCRAGGSALLLVEALSLPWFGGARAGKPLLGGGGGENRRSGKVEMGKKCGVRALCGESGHERAPAGGCGGAVCSEPPRLGAPRTAGSWADRCPALEAALPKESSFPRAAFCAAGKSFNLNGGKKREERTSPVLRKGRRMAARRCG